MTKTLASASQFESLESRTLLSTGGLDPYFGTAGAALVARGASIRSTALAVGRDGSIFTGYYEVNGSGFPPDTVRTLHVRKFLPTGVADPRFIGAGTGELLVPASSGAERLQEFQETRALAPLADGSLLVAAGNGVYKYRFNGSLDRTFGNLGHIDTSDLVIVDIGVQGDGSILLTGASGTSQSNFTIARLHADGSPDLAFGDAGRRDLPTVDVLPDPPVAPFSRGRSIVIAPDGSAYALGTYDVTYLIPDDGGMFGEHLHGFLIARITPDGHFDPGFDDDGLLRIGVDLNAPLPDTDPITYLQGQEILNGAAIDPAGGLQMLTSRAGGFSPRIWHITAAGTLIKQPAPALVRDTLLGNSSLVFLNDGKELQPRVYSEADGTFTMIRNNPDGMRDQTYRAPSFGDFRVVDPAMALASDGSTLLLSADKLASGTSRLFLRRFWRGEGPAVDASARSINSASAQPALITVSYRDDAKVNVASLGHRDLRITGPNGFVGYAKFNRLIKSTNSGGMVRARYSLTAPSGSWDVADNGVYTVRLRADEVTDTAGNRAEARAIATLSINIPAPPAPIKRVAKPSELFSGRFIADTEAEQPMLVEGLL